MRKSWILNQDSSVFKSNDLGADKKKNRLSRAVNVLIPFMGTKRGYIGVRGEYLQTLDFDHADIWYQFQVISNEVTAATTPYDKYYTPIFEYHATKVTAKSLEAFYNHLHNIACMFYMQYLEETSDDDLELVFMDISFLDIRVYAKDGSVVQKYRFRKADDEIPFEMSGNEIVVREVGKRFGFMQDDYNEMLPTILIKESDGDRVWVKVRGRFELFSDIEKIFSPNSIWSSYVMTTDQEYDFLLCLQNATAWLSVIDTGLPNDAPRDKLDILTPTAYVEAPRYSFSDQSCDDSITQWVEYWSEMIDEVVVVAEYDTPAILGLIEYLPFLMKFLVECAKCKMSVLSVTPREVAPEHFIDILDQAFRFTVIAQMSIDITSIIPTDLMLVINTDVYQDYPVNVKDIAIFLEENSEYFDLKEK